MYFSNAFCIPEQVLFCSELRFSDQFKHVLYNIALPLVNIIDIIIVLSKMRIIYTNCQLRQILYLYIYI